MLKVSSSLTLTTLGTLTLNSSIDEVKQLYSLSVKEVEFIKFSIKEFNEGVYSSKTRIEDRNGLSIILNVGDIFSIIATAELYDPTAVAAALSAMGSVAPGGGTIIGAAAIFQAASQAASQAYVQNKRLKIGRRGVTIID